MVQTTADTEFLETKKRTDIWVKEFIDNVARAKGESLSFKHSEGKHTLLYNVMDVKSGKVIAHVVLSDIIDGLGKSKLLSNQDYITLIHIKDKFWDEPIRTLTKKTYAKRLQDAFKNSKIVINFRLE